jgi:hypothetical protein
MFAEPTVVGGSTGTVIVMSGLAAGSSTGADDAGGGVCRRETSHLPFLLFGLSWKKVNPIEIYRKILKTYGRNDRGRNHKGFHLRSRRWGWHGHVFVQIGDDGAVIRDKRFCGRRCLRNDRRFWAHFDVFTQIGCTEVVIELIKSLGGDRTKSCGGGRRARTVLTKVYEPRKRRWDRGRSRTWCPRFGRHGLVAGDATMHQPVDLVLLPHKNILQLGFQLDQVGRIVIRRGICGTGHGKTISRETRALKNIILEEYYVQEWKHALLCPWEKPRPSG